MSKLAKAVKQAAVYFLSHPYQRSQALAAGAAIVEIVRVALTSHA